MTVVAKPVRPVTGWHVLGIFVVFFGIVIAVNVGLAWKAVSTFPGLEVENGYVASQTFDVEMAAQKALGWKLATKYDASANTMALAFTDASGKPVTVGSLTVLVGRTTEEVDDVTPVFTLTDGIYVAPVRLANGKWMMMIEAHAVSGTLFRQRINMYVNR